MATELCFNENYQTMQDYDYDEGYMLDEDYLDEFLDEEYEDAALTPYETPGQSDELYARLADSFETLNADTEGRSGSLTVYMSAATNSPGRPTMKKGACQDLIVPMIGRTISGELVTLPTTRPPTINARPTPTKAPAV